MTHPWTQIVLVNFSFVRWSELLTLDNNILISSIRDNQFTELIYLPYNSCDMEEQDTIETNCWKAKNDEVIMRTGRKIVQPQSSSGETLVERTSEPRQLVHVIDRVFGPEMKEFVSNVMKTPWLLGRAHHHLRCRFQPEPTAIQYTPWAVNSLGKMVDPLRILRFSFQLSPDLKEFPTIMNTIFELIERQANGDTRYRKNYALNLGIRVHFTGGTTTGRLLGVGFQPASERPTILAHLTFTGITAPGPSAMWTRAANHITTVLLRDIPQSIPQWKTEWHGIEMIKAKFREALDRQLEPLNRLAAIADRDGVFLNELLASILYPEPTFYQKLYAAQRNDVLARVAQDLAACLAKH